MIFIYIHGFNSKGDLESKKLKELEKLGSIITLNYNSFDSYDSIYSDLEKQFDKVTDKIFEEHYPDIAIVGSSLGGFWAARLANDFGFYFPTILINPSISPSQSLKRYVGIEMKNYKTGELKIMGKDIPESYPKLPKSPLYLVLLDKGDEILDTEKSEKYFSINTVIRFDGGSHRFEHMAESLPHIKSYINRLQTIHY